MSQPCFFLFLDHRLQNVENHLSKSFFKLTSRILRCFEEQI
jgi:hypothetical protein